MAQLRLFFLGPPRIERGGESVATDTRKAVALLAYLAVTGDRPSRDLLATFLWPEFDERRAKAALRRTLSTAKTAVGEEALYITRQALGVESAALWCDVTAFQEALKAAEKCRRVAGGFSESCLAHLETAAGLYREDFLSGFTLRDSQPFDDWQIQQAEHLRRELTIALEQLIHGYKTTGAFDNALGHARRWLQLDPLHEEAHRQLMQLYAWTGRRTAALSQYRECVRILEEELDVAPLAETVALYETIQSDQLPPPAAEPQPATSLIDPSPSLPSPESMPPEPMPMVGRQAELAAMQQVYDQVGPDGRFLVLTGEAGIGKTRLAEALLTSSPAAVHFKARCYQGEDHLAYAPFVQAMREALRRPEAKQRLASVGPSWLAETARLLPELAENFPDLPAAPTMDWTGASGRFVEGVSRVLEALLTGSQPGILWLDDAQWADAASLDLLAFLTRRWRGRPYLLLLCWRGGNLSADQRLRQLLAETRRDGSGTSLALDRLDPAAVSQFVKAILGSISGIIDSPSPPDLAERLYRETEGLPFLMTAYLQSLSLVKTGGHGWRLPPTARDLFQSFLAQSNETEGQLLQAAAVVGRAFDFDLLQAVSGRSEEESLLALEGLLGRHLLVEQSGDLPYDFYHHKLRELVCEEMSLARRRLLHRRSAETLANRQDEGLTGESAARIAGHYRAARQDELAALFYRQAGDYARSLFAHHDALQHYQNALALGHPDTSPLHEACGDLYIRLGQYSAALASYERAAAICPPMQLARLEHRIGQVYYRRGEWGLAERHFEQAKTLWAETEGGNDLSRLYIDWSTTAYRAGEIEKANSLAEQAQSLAANPLVEAQTQNILGILARKQGALTQAIDHFDQALRLADDHGFLDVQITTSNNLALAEAALDHSQRAYDLLQSALALCLTYGDRHWEAALRNNLADLLHYLDREEEALVQLKQAVAIYAEIGQEIGEARPEIWKLTEW
jgi:DNA-binding SARP family transcriptional activator/predicted ATPase